MDNELRSIIFFLFRDFFSAVVFWNFFVTEASVTNYYVLELGRRSDEVFALLLDRELDEGDSEMGGWGLTCC